MVTQMTSARRGVATDEMKQVAKDEKLEPSVQNPTISPSPLQHSPSPTLQNPSPNLPGNLTQRSVTFPSTALAISSTIDPLHDSTELRNPPRYQVRHIILWATPSAASPRLLLIALGLALLQADLGIFGGKPGIWHA